MQRAEHRRKMLPQSARTTLKKVQQATYRSKQIWWLHLIGLPVVIEYASFQDPTLHPGAYQKEKQTQHMG